VLGGGFWLATAKILRASCFSPFYGFVCLPSGTVVVWFQKQTHTPFFARCVSVRTQNAPRQCRAVRGAFSSFLVFLSVV
jgi:hypothetical protein